MRKIKDLAPAEFSELLGKTLKGVSGLHDSDSWVRFDCSDGTAYLMHHQQDCCESVYLEDVAGDPDDLIGSPLLVAEESNNGEPGPEQDNCDFSETWTFYRLATAKGFVVLRWYGSSNGYYSESVDFERIVR